MIASWGRPCAALIVALTFATTTTPVRAFEPPPEPAAEAAEPAPEAAEPAAEPAPATEPAAAEQAVADEPAPIEPGAEEAPPADMEVAPATPSQPAPTKDKPKRDRVALALMITGYSLLGLGVGLSAGFAVGLVRGQKANDDIESTTRPQDEEDRIDARDDGEKADKLAIGMGAAAGISLVAGAILVAVGHVRHRKKREATASCAPAFGPSMAGMGCRLRF